MIAYTAEELRRRIWLVQELINDLERIQDAYRAIHHTFDVLVRESERESEEEQELWRSGLRQSQEIERFFATDPNKANVLAARAIIARDRARLRNIT